MDVLAIDEKKARQSVKALYAHIHKQQPDQPEAVWLMVHTMRDIVRIRESPPVVLPIKHAIQQAGTRRCLFSRDPQQKIKDLLAQKKAKGIHNVIGLSKFRKSQAKELLDKYDEFLADKRLARVLSKSLGKFYKECRPTYIDLDQPDLQKEIIRVVHTTLMDYRKGSTCAVKIAMSTHTPDQAFDNIRKALPDLLAGLPGGIDNLRSLFIKTSDSSSLPIYQYKDDDHGDDDDDDY